MAKSNLPEAVKAQIDAIREVGQTEVVKIEVDLDAFTAGNVNAYMVAQRMNDVGKITAAMMPFMLSVPPEWGKVDELATYEKLPMATWKALNNHIGEIVNYITSKN